MSSGMDLYTNDSVKIYYLDDAVDYFGKIQDSDWWTTKRHIEPIRGLRQGNP